MPHRILAFALAFLLLAMQHEAQWHALGHFGDWLAQAHEKSWHAPSQDDGACAICALSAGGATAAVGDALAQPKPVPGFELAHGVVSSFTAAAPSYYQSRAPPVLL